jgi:hypothetical protein
LLELGAHERIIAQQAFRSGEPLPDRIANAPELRLGLQLYMQAFFDLDSSRSNSNELTPISWLNIKRYAVECEFDLEQEEALFYHIKLLDNEHLKRLAAKRDAKPKGKGFSGGPKSGRKSFRPR